MNYVGTYKLAWIVGNKAYSVMFDDWEDLNEYVARHITGPYTVFELVKANGSNYEWTITDRNAGSMLVFSHRFRWLILAIFAYLVFYRIKGIFK